MKKQRLDIALREAALNSGFSQRAISRETGLERTSLGRFLNGDTSITLDRAAILADFLGLELRPKPTKGTK